MYTDLNPVSIVFGDFVRVYPCTSVVKLCPCGYMFAIREG